MNGKSKLSVKSRLRQERLLRGWSQQELADQLGTTMVTVSRWERGTQSPGPLMRLKLCTLFEKTERELGFFPEESESDSGSSPSHNRHAVVSTPATNTIADEEPEAIIQTEPVVAAQTEPVVAAQSTQETGCVLLSLKTKEQTGVPLLLARLSSLTLPSSWSPPTQWVSALAGLLLLALMTSLLLSFFHVPKAPVVISFPIAVTEPVPA